MLRAIQSRSLGDQAFHQLFVEIVAGTYPPGHNLPAERALAETLGINRHVVREALKRLEQLGLLRIAQGGSTKVLDFKYNAGLDLLAMLAEHAQGGETVSAHWLSVLEMRAAIGADVVRLCALRASPSIKKQLIAIAEEMTATRDHDALFELEVNFWDRLLEGAGNIAYRLAFNTLLKGTRAIGAGALRLSIEEIERSGYRVELARAIAAGDAAKAEAETRDVMRGVLALVDRPPRAQRGKTAGKSRVARRDITGVDRVGVIK
jgi:GntR family transcriptional regulator, transcriptional repressor for pyruvate dehydrogenase complex